MIIKLTNFNVLLRKVTNAYAPPTVDIVNQQNKNSQKLYFENPKIGQ